MKKILWEMTDYLKILILALIVTNILNVFVFSLSKVQQSSMEPTLVESDQLVVDRLTYNFSTPKRGDIVVFIDELQVDDSIPGRFKRLYEDMWSKVTGDDGHLRLVKRVIGLPGDTVDIEDGKVYINGEILEEDYIDGTVETDPKTSLTYPYTVPENEYFVMGDHRSVSLDSRDFGTIPIEKIEGRVVFRFWPLSKFGTID